MDGKYLQGKGKKKKKTYPSISASLFLLWFNEINTSLDELCAQGCSMPFNELAIGAGERAVIGKVFFLGSFFLFWVGEDLKKRES
jgi:hypothetical protein